MTHRRLEHYHITRLPSGVQSRGFTTEAPGHFWRDGAEVVVFEVLPGEAHDVLEGMSTGTAMLRARLDVAKALRTIDASGFRDLDHVEDALAGKSIEAVCGDPTWLRWHRARCAFFVLRSFRDGKRGARLSEPDFAFLARFDLSGGR